MRKTLLLIPFLLLMISCTSKENIIDGFADPWRAMLIIESPQPAIGILSLPDNQLINQDVYFSANGKQLSSAPTKAADFRNHIYLLFAEEYKIEILDKSTFIVTSVIDFSAGNLKPTDICFPNSTDAYVAHGNDSVVSLLDITVFQIARSIRVGKFPVSISVAGNQIYTANFGDNTVSIIDSRTHTEVGKIGVAPCPIFVLPNNNGDEMLVLSAGRGKIPSESEKTPAVINFINIANRSVISSLEIGVGAQKAIDQIPYGLAVSQKDWAFIPTNTSLFRVDLRSKQRVSIASSKKYTALSYNFRRLEVLLLGRDGSASWFETADQATGKTVHRYNLPSDVSILLPL